MKMTIKYDVVMAGKEIPGGEVGHAALVGEYHRQIGTELCAALNLDFEEYREWAIKGNH